MGFAANVMAFLAVKKIADTLSLGQVTAN